MSKLKGERDEKESELLVFIHIINFSIYIYLVAVLRCAESDESKYIARACESDGDIY